jgi:hypothetical protein
VAGDGAGAVAPRLVLGDGSPHEVLDLLATGGETGRELLRDVVAMVIDEGRRFAATPEGERVAEAFVGSPLHKNGKVLWTIGGADELLDGEGAPPRALPRPDGLLEALRDGAIEDYMMRILEDYAEQRFGAGRAQAAPGAG